MKYYYIYLLISVFFIYNCSNEVSNHTVELRGTTMGTTYSIKLIDSKLTEESDKQIYLKNEIDSILAEVNNQMSTWQKDSEISKFNLSKSTDWFEISDDFLNVVEAAQKISEVSDGAFDITVGPLVNLWGFGPLVKKEIIPSESDIEKAKSLCNYKKILTRKENPAVKKEIADANIDLSSIAKGFGVDKISNYFISKGFNNFMVEIGGEVRTFGKNQNNVPWKIGISVPDGSFEIQKVLEVQNFSIATSGDYRNYFERDGIRYSHTIDPRTGKPIIHYLASVTVAYDNCTFADGYATAIDVLGPDEGYLFALKEKLPVLMIVKTEKGFVEKMTPEFVKLFNN